MRSPFRSFLRCAGLVAWLLTFAGCASTSINDPARAGPFFEPRNVSRDPTLGAIRRVLLMPVWGGAGAPEESLGDLDPIFRKALQDENRFEVVTMTRAECQRRFGATAIASSGALPYNFFATVQRVYAADAVLFIDITVHRAYRPLALGIRGRLAFVGNQRLAWSADNVFSADDPLVANSARRFFLQSGHHGVPGDMTPAVLQSPGRFAAYAAAATFATLPPVTLAKVSESSTGGR